MATAILAVKKCNIYPAYLCFCVMKWSIVIYSLLLSGISTSAGSTTDNSIRLSKRDTTPIDDSDILWEVKLRSLAALRCSGALLDSSWVLTAASCFQGNYLQPNNYNVELYNNATSTPTPNPSTSPSSSPSPSSSSSSSPSSSSSSSLTSSSTPHHSDQSIYVEAFYLHGRFLEGQSRHNLALVHLHDDVTSRSVFTDVIGSHDDVNGNDCVSVGWGSNVTGEPVEPSIRLWRVLSHVNCSERYPNISPVPPDQLCALPLDSPDASGAGVCSGDIGAPLLCRHNLGWTVHGLVTHAWRCHDNDHDPQPARFLSIQHYLPFLQKRGNFK